MSRPPFSPAWIAYRLITRALEPLVPRLLDARAARGKEDAARLDERLGIASQARPDGDLVWLHGVSVGEALSLLSVVERLRRSRPELAVLVTTGTVTAASLMAERLPPGVIHQYLPVDGPRATQAFFDHWRPRVGVLVESELWPNLIETARKSGVELILASARVTQRTVQGWRRTPGLARRLLTAFHVILPQDEVSGQRLTSLGARVDETVNLKLSADALPYDAAAFDRLSAAIGDRPVVVAASTHPGEELALVQALDASPRPLCLILVPRHPERGPPVATDLTRAGYRFVLRSRGGDLDAETDLYIADTLGELGLFLRLADVVVMGGAFAPALDRPMVGGHNPLEPARLGKPIVTGPDFANWTSVVEGLRAAEGLIVAATLAEAAQAVDRLLADGQAARAMGERARRAAVDLGAGAHRLSAHIQSLLPTTGSSS